MVGGLIGFSMAGSLPGCDAARRTLSVRPMNRNDRPVHVVGGGLAGGEAAGLPPAAWDSVIVATGPLTSPALAAAIAGLTGESSLAFFDAIAPIVHKESIDLDKAWFQSRYDKPGPGGGTADYINCPLEREDYEAFVAALLAGE